MIQKSMLFLAALFFSVLIVKNARAEGEIHRSRGNYRTNEPSQGKPVSVITVSKMDVYFLSGLGADERVFSKLKLDTTQFNIRNVKWISPLKKESMNHYATRLLSQMDTTQPFQLVGLSFGGIMASVLSDIVHPKQIIIISSTPTGVPLSKFYQGCIRFLLLSPFAGPFLKSANSFTYKYFGADTPEMKALLKQILKDTDTKFLKWALNSMTSWKHPQKAEHLYHIHGAADRLIPLKLVKPDIEIPGGGHLMIYQQHDRISEILNERLKIGANF